MVINQLQVGLKVNRNGLIGVDCPGTHDVVGIIDPTHITGAEQHTIV